MPSSSLYRSLEFAQGAEKCKFGPVLQAEITHNVHCKQRNGFDKQTIWCAPVRSDERRREHPMRDL
jgi:hypothetical protein